MRLSHRSSTWTARQSWPFWKFDQKKDPAVVEEDEALSDFQFYAAKDKKPLGKRGIRFHEIYDTSFILKVGNQTSIVRAKLFRYGVGYYLIAPGAKPQIEQGVMTDLDLLEAAGKYISTATK
jgi:hypothetical protein